MGRMKSKYLWGVCVIVGEMEYFDNDPWKVAKKAEGQFMVIRMNCAAPQDQQLRHVENSYRMGVASLFGLITAKQLSYVIKGCQNHNERGTKDSYYEHSFQYSNGEDYHGKVGSCV